MHKTRTLLMSFTRQNNSIKIIYITCLALLTWLSLVIQLYLTTGSVLNYFSYFTILSNLLIAVSLTLFVVAPYSKPGIFFSNLSTQSAIALYIFIVALVYNTVLRGIILLTGWQLIVDTLLHVVIPVLYILFWLLYRSGGIVKWTDGLYWVLFPLFYLIYSLIRGSFVNWYPYPFLNATKLGYTKVLMNVSLMIGVFFIVGLLVIALTRSFKKK